MKTRPNSKAFRHFSWRLSACTIGALAVLPLTAVAVTQGISTPTPQPQPQPQPTKPALEEGRMQGLYTTYSKKILQISGVSQL